MSRSFPRLEQIIDAVPCCHCPDFKEFGKGKGKVFNDDGWIWYHAGASYRCNMELNVVEGDVVYTAANTATAMAFLESRAKETSGPASQRRRVWCCTVTCYMKSSTARSGK